MNGKYQVGSGRVVTFTHDIPFIDISISDSGKSVNPQISPPDKGSMSADRSTYMTARELLLQAMEDEELKKSSKHQKRGGKAKFKLFIQKKGFLKEMTDDNILYLSENKKETKEWFQSLGAQMPLLGESNLGFICMLSQSSSSVNPKIAPTDKGSMSADRSTYMTARELLLQAMEDEELKKSSKHQKRGGKAKFAGIILKKQAYDKVRKNALFYRVL